MTEAYISKPGSDMPALSPEVAQMTFGDVAGMSLTFFSAKRPSGNCLKFHCHTAVFLAEDRGWLPHGAGAGLLKDTEFLKDTDTGQHAVQDLTMQLFWRSIEEQGAPSEDPNSVADSDSSGEAPWHVTNS